MTKLNEQNHLISRPTPRGHTCCEGDPKQARQLITIMGLCAHGDGNPAFYCTLIDQTDQFDGWKYLPVQAEQHGLAPLIALHLQAADTLVPSETLRTLKALALRHQHANRMRFQALCEAWKALITHGIEAFVLKGAALSHLVYPNPSLRPMRDVDLLVRSQDRVRAQQLLVENGFQTAKDLRLPADHHHLPILERKIGGVQVYLEIHHDLFPRTRFYRSMKFEDLEHDARSIWIEISNYARSVANR